MIVGAPGARVQAASPGAAGRTSSSAVCWTSALEQVEQ